jgi:hypothetical protein
MLLMNVYVVSFFNQTKVSLKTTRAPLETFSSDDGGDSLSILDIVIKKTSSAKERYLRSAEVFLHSERVEKFFISVSLSSWRSTKLFH